VLRNGRWEKSRDRIEAGQSDWSYSLRGQTLDQDKDVRVVVAFRENRMMVVTAYEVGAEKG
jgi:hypothetical protein